MPFRRTCGCALALTTGCAATGLPSPDVASSIAPEVPELERHPPPAGPGMGLVVIDSVSGPAEAERVTGRGSATSEPGDPWSYRFGGRRTDHWVSKELLCTSTPCASYMPYGEHEVTLVSNEDPRRSATYVVDVTDKPRALRASLDESVPGDTSYWLGVVGLGAGAAALAAGAYFLASPTAPGGGLTPDEGVAAATLLGTGAVLGIVGGVLFLRGHGPRRYEGHGIEWTFDESDLGAGRASSYR